MYKPLNKKDAQKLKQLNDEVNMAIKKRREWLNTKMLEYSDLQIGDYIYDVRTGRKLGKVSEIYRYWAKRNELMDNDLTFDYQYETSPKCFDNTSRQVGLWYGTKKEVIEYAKNRVNSLQTKI